MSVYRILELHTSEDPYRFKIEVDLSIFNGFFGREWWPVRRARTLEDAKKVIEELTYEPKVIAEYGT